MYLQRVKLFVLSLCVSAGVFFQAKSLKSTVHFPCPVSVKKKKKKKLLLELNLILGWFYNQKEQVNILWNRGEKSSWKNFFHLKSVFYCEAILLRAEFSEKF